MWEPLKNGQVDQQIRRRPVVAVASPRPTVGRFPRRSEDFGAADAATSGFAKLTQAPHGRPDGRRRTATHETALEADAYGTTAWNKPLDSRNGDAEDPSNLPEKRREGTRLRTGWELPELIRPLPERKRRCHTRTPHILPHHPALVEYVYFSRFVTASQIQRRFPEWLRTARTTQWQLANLVELGLLATAHVRSTSPNFPFVYFTTGKGIALVNQTYARHGLTTQHSSGEGRKGSGVAVESLLHELLLSEFELAVRNSVAARNDLSLLATERRYYRRDLQLRFSQKGKGRHVIPDAGFVVRLGERSDGTSENARFMTQLNFVELDNGTMSPRRLLEKLQQYAAWNASDSGESCLQQTYGCFKASVPTSRFRLLLIVHDKTKPNGDEKRLAALFEQVLALPADMRDRTWLATAADLKAYQHHSSPLSAEIWYRGRDAKGWLAHYEHENDSQGNTSLRQFISEHLRSLPRHPLFPREANTSTPPPDKV